MPPSRLVLLLATHRRKSMPRFPIRDSLSLDPPSTHPCPVHTPNSFATFVVRITRVMPLFFDTGADTFSRRCWSSAFQITSPILYRPLISECFRRCLWIRIQHLKSFRGKQKELTPFSEVSPSFAILLTPSTFNALLSPKFPHIAPRYHQESVSSLLHNQESSPQARVFIIFFLITTFVI